MANNTGTGKFEHEQLSQPVLLGDNADVQPEDQTTRMTEIVNKQDVQKNDINDSRTTTNDGVLANKQDVQKNDVSVARTNVNNEFSDFFFWFENKIDTSVMQNKNTVTNRMSDGTLPAGEITAECCQIDAVCGVGSDESKPVKKGPLVNYSSGSECDYAEHQAMDTGAQASQYDGPNQSCAQSIDQRSLSKANAVNKPYKCDLCSAAFKRNRKLKLHQLSHTGEKLFKCDVCEAAFSRLSNLKGHERIHTGERPFKCDVCDADFRKKIHLRNHKINAHADERSYKCDVCGECFEHSETFRIHKRTHMGEKLYKCDDCDAAFAQHSKLMLHKIIHTGERPFKCDVCGAAFARRNNLRSHKKRRHAGEKS